jgi:outer membrane beta-barrel protein
MKTLVLVLSIILRFEAFALENKEQTSPSAEGEAIYVSKVAEKYWAQGKDTELGVVQNRKYTSAHRFELDIFTGSVSTDPFLSVHQYGGSLGYHFNQYLSAHAIAWRSIVSNSDAYTSFKAQTSNASVDLNRPKGFYGLQLNENFLYGKASLFGSAIIYVDIFALGGVGITDTESGKNFTAFIGLGQKIHLNQTLALHLDYRIMKFNETIPSVSGKAGNDRSNTTDVVTLGLCFFY